MGTASGPRDNQDLFASAESAAAWQRSAARRAATWGAATERMLDLADLKPGDRVLDLAAGTGEQTLLALGRVGPSGHVLATDLAADMLAVAAQAAKQAGLANVETRVLDAHATALPDAGSVVLCGDE